MMMIIPRQLVDFIIPVNKKNKKRKRKDKQNTCT